jgi:hypothetical protein
MPALIPFGTMAERDQRAVRDDARKVARDRPAERRRSRERVTAAFDTEHAELLALLA